MEKEKLTLEKAIEKNNENYEEIKIAQGKVRVSKAFFATTGTIGALSAGVGAAGIITNIVGVTLLPIALPLVVTGLGVAAAGVSAKFYKDEQVEQAILEDKEAYNDSLNAKFEEKAKAKVKTK